MNKGFLQDVAKEAKCEEATVDAINRITLARELWELLTEKIKIVSSHYFYKM